MQLAKLELSGFKSFADRTEFSFEPGMTAFVGPNGCGKSNVVDAFRWILGSQSPKALRGTEMLDVIFNGTETRHGAGYAEASLTILNTRGILPSEYAELCITRRLYRTGESEYLLNGQPCRLRDIRVLLMDTGLGMDTYSLIEQGRVDRILQANPAERRQLFDEAAGISGFKAQKKDADARLERAAQNLLRINDVIAEKEKQLRSIKYQAAKARRHREMTDRLRDLSVSFSRREFVRLTGLRQECQAKINGLQTEMRRRNEEIAALEEQRAKLDQTLAERDARIQENEQLLHSVDSDRNATEERIRSGMLRIQELEAAAQEAAERVGVLSERQERAQTDINSATLELAEIRAAVEVQTEAVNRQVAAARAAASERERLDRAIEEWKARVVDVLQKAAALRNEITHLEDSRHQELGRRARLLARRDELDGKIAALSEQIEIATRAMAAAKERLNALAARRKEAEAAMAAKATELGELDQAIDALRTRCTAGTSRRQILQEMEAHADGIAQGVKRLLERDENGQSRLAETRGLVADLIQVDMQYAAAIDAALADSAQYLVLATTEEARHAVTMLREKRWGRGGFLALERLHKEATAGAELMGCPGVVGRAVDLVRCRPGAESVVRALLGQTVVVETLERAFPLAGRTRLVTLDGDLLEADGGAIIAGGGAAQTGLVSRRSELAALTVQLDALTAELATRQAARDAVKAAADEIQRGVEALRVEQLEVERTIAQTEGTIAHLLRQRDRLEEEREVVRSEVQEIDRNIQSYLDRQADIRSDLGETEKTHDRLHGEVEAARQNLQRQRETVEQLAQEVTTLRISLAQKEEKQGSLAGRVENLRHASAEMNTELEAARGQIESYRQRKAQAEEQLAADRARVMELSLQYEREQQQLNMRREERETVRQEQQKVEAEVRARRGQLNEVQERLQSAMLAENEHGVRLAALEERVREEFQIDLREAPAPVEAADGTAAPTDAEAPAAAEPLVIDEQAVKAEIADLQEQLRRMGPVNLEAIAQQDELEEGIAFRIQQREDLLAAERELRELVQRLNTVCRERFESTFTQVRDNFREIFRKIFGGGKADVCLEEGVEDILDAGIEIYACPPEKDLKSINLLSGGEKTMTTIALLFALFKTKPSPFCILDEVDAALDEANTGRFATMVREFIDKSQFIVITHSKRTMSVADVLYGITMEEKGVSKKVAVRLDQTAELVA